MRSNHAASITVAALVVLLGTFVAHAANSSPQAVKTAKKSLEVMGRICKMKPPEGFELARADRRGIVRWRKGTAEIQIVAGDVVSQKPRKQFDELFKAAQNNDRIEKVKRIRIRGGRAFVYTEKAPQDPKRLRTMRLMAISSRHVVNVDFSAPSEDFDSYTKDFETALKSFRMR